MLEIIASLKFVTGRQQAQAVCPTVKYCHYILGRRWAAEEYGGRLGKKMRVSSKVCH
jgi:hypothetical protein